MWLNLGYEAWCCHGNSILKGMFSWNLNFLFIFYIKLDCDAWDRVFWRNLEHNCFKTNDVIIVYFWLSELFLFRYFFLFGVFYTLSTEIV